MDSTYSLFSFAAAPIYQVSTKTKISNAALGGACIVFIGGVYSYSMYKMKQGGEDVAAEIEIHEANLAAAKAAAAAEVGYALD